MVLLLKAGEIELYYDVEVRKGVRGNVFCYGHCSEGFSHLNGTSTISVSF